jgi:predicted DNA-binding transcriptional regulator AlpA
MSKFAATDFRETFAKMADQAVITRAELAALLATTQGAISQMAYRGELPTSAFPGKRRACWFARDIRQWLNEIAATRLCSNVVQDSPAKAPLVTRTGRPRLPAATLR